MLARRTLGTVPDYFRLNSFRVIDERRYNAAGELVTMSEATVKVEVGGEQVMTVAEGNGPVNALDLALRKALEPAWPAPVGVRLPRAEQRRVGKEGVRTFRSRWWRDKCNKK